MEYVAGPFSMEPNRNDTTGADLTGADQSRGEPGAGTNGTRRHDRLALVLILAQLALLVHMAWRVGPTFDEHFYIAAGYAYLEDGHFSLNREHPPLLKLLAALPLKLAGGVDFPAHWRDLVDYPVNFFYQRNAEHFERNLFLARLPLCALCALLSFAVYRVGRAMLGARAGLVALILCAFDPNVLAHGSLAALDGGTAALFFMAVASLVALLERPSAGRALGAGVLFGLANLAKFTSLLLVPLGAALALIACVRGRRVAPLGWTALTWLAGLSVFAAVYRYEARSANEAWGERPYVAEVRPEREEATPGELAIAAARVGVPGDVVQRALTAPTTADAVDALAEQLDGGGVRARAALLALRTLHDAPSDVRKRAFRAVLDAAPALEEDAVLGALAHLAHDERPTVEAWRVWYERRRMGSWDRALFTQPWIDALTRGVLGDETPIPLFSAWKGLDYQIQHGSDGHASYFRGRTLGAAEFREGNPHPEYYLVVMLVKHPLAWLLVVGAGLVLWRRPGPQRTAVRTAAFVGAPLVLFVSFSLGNVLMGIRYVLPVVPFLAVAGGVAALRFPRAALALALVAAVSGNWVHPHQLMYYNALVGGPTGGPELTVVGDDWGQGLRALGAFRERWADEIEAAGGFHYEPYAAGDVTALGLGGTRPVRGELRGIVAVNLLSYWRDPDPKRPDQRAYLWLDEYEPFARLDRSILVFDTREPPPGGNPLPEWERARAGAGPR